jgi:hypothetical protein
MVRPFLRREERIQGERAERYGPGHTQATLVGRVLRAELYFKQASTELNALVSVAVIQ